MSDEMKVQIAILTVIFAAAVYGLITTYADIITDIKATAKREREEKKRREENARGDRKGT